jgi:cysteinyl-tRNA synthetase
MTKTPLSLFDTRSRELLPISSSDGQTVRMYSCGPTVYRDAHVGNLRTFLLSDLITRILHYSGFQTTLVQNITDVGHMSEDLQEDKLLAESTARKIDPFEIARDFEAKFHQDLKLIGVDPANFYPRASESIEMMQSLIVQLIEKGHAYVGDDASVYFDARSFESYGEISGNRLDALKPGHRYEYTDDGAKRFHADWALWKSAGNRTEMIWDSPWGPGFPGWHIECSAMSLHYLHGEVDLHLGGIDLRFPHHENERAQSNAAAGYEVVHHWVHGEHLLFEGRKMSKSAGNVLLVRDIIERGLDPLALRLAFLENRYRSQIDLTWDALSAADSTIKRWRRKLKDWGQSTPTQQGAEIIESLIAHLHRDLGTADAIVELRRVERDETITGGVRASIFRELEKIFALDLDRAVEAATLSHVQEALLLERAEARAAKDFAKSDLLRDQLRTLGIEVKDSASGQSYEIIQ